MLVLFSLDLSYIGKGKTDVNKFSCPRFSYFFLVEPDLDTAGAAGKFCLRLHSKKCRRLLTMTSRAVKIVSKGMLDFHFVINEHFCTVS